MSRTNPESIIQSAICEYLSAKGIFFSRSNNIPVPIQKPGGRFQMRKLPKHTVHGWPDIVAIVRGQFVGIEVKTEKGYLSPAQVECRDCIQKAGGRFVLARSIDDVEKALAL